MKRGALLAITVAVLVGCQDQQSLAPRAPRDPGISPAISDGSRPGGNPDFFFLPPILPTPRFDDPNFDRGAFNPNLAPAVDICELTATLPATCVAGPPVAHFGSVDVDVRLDWYHVNWDTDDSQLDVNKTYRIRVLVGSTLLGFADVDPVRTILGLRNVQTNEYIGLVNGRTLPIRFRIENNALCPDATQCTSQTITATETSNVALTEGPNAGSGVTVPPQEGGTFPGGVQQVTVTVEPCAEGEGDVPTDLLKVGPCFHIVTDPVLSGPLTTSATVSLCFDLSAVDLSHEQKDLLQIHRVDDAGHVEALENVSDHCPTVVGSGPANPLLHLAWAGWKAIKDAVMPTELWATHKGLGGLALSFSRFQFQLPAKFAIYEGDGQTKRVGTAVPIAPAVRVTDENGDPVHGATVGFTVTAGDGSVVPATPLKVTTDADGIARVTSWTMGALPATNLLEAGGVGLGAAPTESGFLSRGTLTFSATATPETAEHTLISGNGAIGGTDPNNEFLGDDESWHPAYIVAPVSSYSTIDGTHYINYNPTYDGATNASRTYRTTFELPEGFSNASLGIDVHADNVATIILNGTQIGMQTDAEIGSNFQGDPEHYSTAIAELFHAGTNTITFVIKNYSGPTAFDYKAVLTYTNP
jgi:hypothetical protein